jgi:hypothetical protein
MAKFRITGPDGGTYEVSAPDGASEQDVLQYAMTNMGGKTGTQPAAEPAKPAEPGPDVLPDMAKSFGSGVVKGAIGMAALPRTLMDLSQKGGEWIARQAGVEPGPGFSGSRLLQQSLPSFQGMRDKVEGVTGPLHEPQTTPGKYAGTVGEFATGAAFPGGMVQRVLGNVVAPAIASEAAGQAAEGTPFEVPARMGGAVLGGHIANFPARAYTPAPATPARRAQVQTLQNEGVTSLSAGDRTGNINLRYAEDAAYNTPGSGTRAEAMKQAQSGEFTRAALRRAGVDADNVLPEVMDRAFADIGGRFDRLATATTANLNRADQMRIDTAVNNYLRNTAPTNIVPSVTSYVRDIRSHAGNPIPGRVYAQYRKDMEADARGLMKTDDRAANALREIRNVLDDAAERAMPAAMRGEWQQTRRHYRNLLVVEKAASTNAATEGVLTPSALLNATKQLHGMRAYVRGQGDYADLARAGHTVMQKLPNSGTAQRQAALQVGQMAAGGALGTFGYGGPEGAAGGAVAPFLVKGMLARGLMSRPMQAYLANQALPQNVINTRLSAYASSPAATFQALGLLDDDRKRP